MKNTLTAVRLPNDLLQQIDAIVVRSNGALNRSQCIVGMLRHSVIYFDNLHKSQMKKGKKNEN